MYEISFDRPLTDHHLLRNALGRFATGVAVITTCTANGKREGVTSNSFSAVSLDPPLVLWSLRREAPSLNSFIESGCFAVSVLSSDQSDLSRYFATARRDKFDSMFHHEGLGDCPLLDNALATFECTVETALPGGDHIVFLGRVRRATYRDGDPLIFAAGGYYAPAPLECG